MADDWEESVGLIGPIQGVMGNYDEVDGISGSDEDEFGWMTVDDGSFRGFGGFGNLYKYELSHKSEKTKQWIYKATKYVVPAVGRKNDFKCFVGDTVEAAIKKYEAGVAKGGDTETTFTSPDHADQYLKEKHGFMGTEIWHVTKLTDMGPVNPIAPPAYTPPVTTPVNTIITPTPTVQTAPPPPVGTPTVQQQAQGAIDAGTTEQQIMAITDAAKPTTIGTNMMYLGIGILAIIIVGGVAFAAWKLSPTGQAASAAGSLGQAAGGMMSQYGRPNPRKRRAKRKR